MNFKDKFNTEFECDFNFSGCNALILSGGAMKCLYFLGALSFIQNKNNINFEFFGGTSCGAILSTLLCIGLSPFEIFKEFVKEKKNLKIAKVLEETLEKMEELFENKGFDKHITFKELYEKTGKEIAFVATNITKFREEIFSHKTSPDTPVIVGIKLSCSLPILFPLAKYNNNIFADGIFFDNFPIKLCKMFDNRKKVLALTTSSSYYDKNKIKTFYSRSDIYKIVIIPDIIKKYFTSKRDDQFCMFISGYNYILEKCKINNREKNRRNSI